MLLGNTSDIFKRISHAAMRAGRSPEEVRLVAVTKTVGVRDIEEAIDVGMRIFGENRVQEAQKKIEYFRGPRKDFPEGNASGVQWHMIGHLQKNKAKYAVRLFDLIHTVDSIGLAEELGKCAEKAGKVQRVLVQVKLSEEEAKHGAREDALLGILGRIKELGSLRAEGLMTMPPFFDDPGQARPYFRRLKELRDEAERAGYRLPELSMGMSGDFETAIEEGATLVRIGSAIFGERKGKEETR